MGHTRLQVEIARGRCDTEQEPERVSGEVRLRLGADQHPACGCQIEYRLIDAQCSTRDAQARLRIFVKERAMRHHRPLDRAMGPWPAMALHPGAAPSIDIAPCHPHRRAAWQRGSLNQLCTHLLHSDLWCASSSQWAARVQTLPWEPGTHHPSVGSSRRAAGGCGSRAPWQQPCCYWRWQHCCQARRRHTSLTW